MFKLNIPFINAQSPVTLPLEAVFKSLLQYEDKFTEDSRFTNDVFLTLGINRTLKAGARTLALFARPEEKLKAVVRGKYEQPLDLPGSEAAFITFYKTWGGDHGFAFVLRDRVTDIKNTARNKHVVAAMSGIVTNADTFQVLQLREAELDKTGWVQALHSPALTAANATRILASLHLGFGQLSAGYRLNTLGNQGKIQGSAPEALKSLTFQP